MAVVKRSKKDILPDTSKYFQRLTVGKTRKAMKIMVKAWKIKPSFKPSLKKVKKFVAPKMMLEKLTLDQMDNLIAHVLKLLGMELGTLKKSSKSKTLTLKDLETAVKLLFPKCLAKSSIEFARMAIKFSEGLDNIANRTRSMFPL